MRYRVEKQEEEVRECWHPLCETLHRPWREQVQSHRGGWFWVCLKPVAPRVTWIIVDSETGERAPGSLSDEWDRKRDAVAFLSRWEAQG